MEFSSIEVRLMKLLITLSSVKIHKTRILNLRIERQTQLTIINGKLRIKKEINTNELYTQKNAMCSESPDLKKLVLVDEQPKVTR